MYRVLGIALVLLAIGLAVVPHFTDCLSQGDTLKLANGNTQPMKCHWTAQAEIAVGIPLGVVGIMLPFSRRSYVAMTVSATVVSLGAVALAVPYALIGTCTAPTHICNTVMKPALTALGSVTVLGGLVVLALTRRTDS